MAPLINIGRDVIHGSEGFGTKYEKAQFFGVALEKDLQILSSEGAFILTIPYTHDPHVWSRISLGTIPRGDRIFVRYEAGFRTSATPEKDSKPSFVDEMDLKGNVLHSYRMEGRVYDQEHQAAWKENVMLFAAPTVPAVVFFVSSWVSSHGHASDEPSVWVNSSEDLWKYVLILFSAGVAFGLWSFYWGRSAGFPKRQVWWWAAFVFCFGLPGLIVYRFSADWPRRVACPNCGRKRSLETGNCPHCHEAWRQPERNGTEIFDAAVNG